MNSDWQVSDFIGTFQQQEEEKYQLQILKYIPELNEVIGQQLGMVNNREDRPRFVHCREDLDFYIFQCIIIWKISFLASTSRRHLVVWKYNPSGCITALKCSSNLESLCYSKCLCYSNLEILCYSKCLCNSISVMERVCVTESVCVTVSILVP